VTPASSTFAALRAPNYRFYWIGLVFYVLGHRAEYVTIAWITWELTRDPLALAWLGLAQGAPLVVFQLVGGVLADRMNRLRLLIVTQILTAITLTVAAVLAALGLMSLPYLLALAAVSSTFRAFDEPSRLALIPQIVERERLSNAIALGSIPWQAGRMIGPSITGILIAAFGGTIGLALAAIASYAALVMYARLRILHAMPAGDGHHVVRQLADGLVFVARDFVFLGLIGLALFNAVFAVSYLTLLPIYADDYFGTGSTGYGLLSAAHGTGSLTATLTLATVIHRTRRPGVVLLIASVCLGVELIVFARSTTMWLAVPVLIAVGFSNTFSLTHMSTLLQQKVPDQLRGRVMSIYSLCWNLIPLGGLLAGALAAAVDARFAVALGGAMVAVNALVLLSSRRLRAIRYDDWT
jgi:predicted MFS family arabinose efflux permease